MQITAEYIYLVSFYKGLKFLTGTFFSKWDNQLGRWILFHDKGAWSSLHTKSFVYNHITDRFK